MDEIEGLLDGINTCYSESVQVVIDNGQVYVISEWGEILFYDLVH